MIKEDKLILQSKISRMFVDNNLSFPYTWSWQENEHGIFYVDSLNKRRYGFIKKCKYCDRDFIVRNSWKETVVVCSRFCGHATKEKKMEVSCDWCNNLFCRVQSKFKNSKSGLNFCGKICKDKAQQIGGIKAIHPSHYNDGITSYSKRAFREYGCKCVDCNITMKTFLHVHHKDGNRKNGDLSNLEVVCSIHHMLRHMVFLNGKWIVDFKELTDLKDLEKLKEELMKI